MMSFFRPFLLLFCLKKTVKLIVFGVGFVVGSSKKSSSVPPVFLARGLRGNLVGSGYHDNSRVIKQLLRKYQSLRKEKYIP